MSKAFTNEDNNNQTDDDNLDEIEDVLPVGLKNLMTPRGAGALQNELYHLLHVERPRIVEIVSWAAGNGDRSENGDYLYNKKRLREIDRRVRYLMKRLDNAEVVDPRQQQNIDRVFFGATVTYIRADDSQLTVKLVGVDEADMDAGKINWLSPVARALMKAQEGDSVDIRLPSGTESIEIITIEYIIED